MNRIFSKFLTNKQPRQDTRIGNQNEFGGLISPSVPLAVVDEPVEFTSNVDFTNATVTGLFSPTDSLSVTNTLGGSLTLKYKTASKTFAGGATEVIPVAVPANCIIVGAQIRNDTILEGSGVLGLYTAAYSGGATQTIAASLGFFKNLKVNIFFTVQGSGEATNITSNTTNITLTPADGTLDTGTVTAVVYYYELTTLDSVA